MSVLALTGFIRALLCRDAHASPAIRLAKNSHRCSPTHFRVRLSGQPNRILWLCGNERAAGILRLTCAEDAGRNEYRTGDEIGSQLRMHRFLCSSGSLRETISERAKGEVAHEDDCTGFLKPLDTAVTQCCFLV